MAGDHGLEMSFVATRSGLTRVRVFDLTPRIKKLADIFIQRHNKAVDESWYSRTVDWNMRFQESATIITAPYNAYIRLIVKFRQRITQRHPAANDTRANCDPRLGYEESNGTDTSANTGGGAPGGGDATSEKISTGESPSSAPEMPASGASISILSDDPSTSDPLGSGPKPIDAEMAEEPDPMLLKDQDFNKYSTFDFLDLIGNSSVHISATQSIIINKSSKQRQAVAVTGLLYDYATFARRFLNATSLDIQVLDSQAKNNGGDSLPQYDPSTGQSLPPVKIDICPNGDCPTKCGLRNDTIDCLLVDNNGFIVVGEELPHIGRSLVEYDEKLMASLVERQVFHQVNMIDYQAICTKTPAEVGAPAGPSASMASVANSMAQSATASSNPANSIMHDPFNFGLAKTMISNLGTIGTYIWSSLFTMMFYQSTMSDIQYIETKFNNILGDLGVVSPTQIIGDYDNPRYPSIDEHIHWSRSPLSLADAQLVNSNQSLLALLPNKTYLRPCERTITLYETRPLNATKLTSYSPEYYVTKCNCSGWYVYEAVPNTNLIMLVVNTTSSCRRCQDTNSVSSNFVPVILPTLEPQVNPGPQPTNGLLNQPYVSPNKTNEDAVCSMLELEAQLYVKRPDNCISYHPDESQIHICGAAFKTVIPLGRWLLLSLLSFLAVLLYLVA